MNSTAAASLRPMQTGSGRRLLIGKTSSIIPIGAVLVLTRDPDNERFTLHAATPDDAANDPSTLASFLSPEDVDRIEEHHALTMAIPEAKPKRKPKKRKSAAATTAIR